MGSFLKFWEPREEFLILEVSPSKTRGLLLNLDQNKNISVSRSWENVQLNKFVQLTRGLNKREVIVSADPSLGLVLQLPIKIQREGRLEDYPIVLVELENLLARSIDKSFGSLRKASSSKFGIDEIDTILIGVKSRDFRIDGHKVHDLLGFTGRAIEVILDFTFTTRGIFEALKEVLGAPESFFFTAAPLAIFHTANHLSPKASVVFLKPGTSSFVFLGKDGRTVAEKDLNWSFADFLESIAARAEIREDVGRESFLGGTIMLKDERPLQPVVRAYFKKLASELKKSSESRLIYIVSSEPFPFSLPKKIGDVVFDSLPIGKALDRFGFNFEDGVLREDETFTRLAPFFESRFDRSDLEINRRLRRRINWLVR